MRKKWIIFIVLIILNIMFIWGNSMLSQDSSHNLSSVFRDLLNRLLHDTINVDNSFSENFVRKLAHVFEYLVLGLLVALCFLKPKLRVWIAILAAGVLTASIDEIIQIFTGRGPAVKDVMIDTCGYFLGFLIASLAKYIRGKKHGLSS